MAFAVSDLTTTTGVVQPRLAVGVRGLVAAWTGERDHEVLALARREADTWTVTRHASPSASVELAAGPDGAVWGVWDVGQGTNGGCSYHVDGVSLFAGRVDGGELAGTLVSDQLWTHCYGAGYAIAVGPGGEPRVAYVVRDRLYVARRDGAAWAVEKGPLVERDTLAFAIDARGRSHVLFEREHVLHHAVHDGTWKPTALTQRYDVHHPSIAIDPAGRAHIAYLSSAKSKDQLHYLAQRDDGTFAPPEIVDKKGNAGFGATLVLDAAGTPIIAYRVEPSRNGASSRRVADVEHRLATRAGDTWRVEPIATGGAGTAFALAGSTAHVVFPTSTRGNLSHATREL